MTLDRDEAWGPADAVMSDHRAQLELCSILETIADELPDVTSSGLVTRALDIIQETWQTHIALEEECLFPMLRSRIVGSSMAHDILDRLEAEHASDDDVVGEVILALEGLQSAQPAFEPAAAGYLLRSFFESQRRHIAWEAAVVVPLIEARFDRDDRKRVRDWLSARKQAAIETRDGEEECQKCGACTCGRALAQ